MLAEARRDGARHVFAEAVGSCADLGRDRGAAAARSSAAGPVDRVSFTAMVDARLLIRLQAGEPLPWSGDVAHLFLEQLREAPLLVASKWDLVTEGYGHPRAGADRALSGRAHASRGGPMGRCALRSRSYGHR